MAVRIPPPCSAYLGTDSWEDLGDRVRVVFTSTEAMGNPFGLVQGGILTAMMDNAAGLTLFLREPTRMHTTTSMSVSFLRPVKAGEKVLAEARVVRSGASVAFLEVDLLREDGSLAARGTLNNLWLVPPGAASRSPSGT